MYDLGQPTNKFPCLFSNDFGPSALLSASPTLTTHINYGENVTRSPSMSHHALSISRPTIELPLDELLDSYNEETPSASSGPDTNTTANAVRDSDIVMQDLADVYMHTSMSRTDTYPVDQGPSPPIPRTGATPTPSPTVTLTPNANTGTTDPSITTSTGAHLTSGMTHTKRGPSARMRRRLSLTLRTSPHSTRSSTGPSVTASGLPIVGCGASSVGTTGNVNVNGNGTSRGCQWMLELWCDTYPLVETRNER
ncbi:hypothetical protein EDC04DRAFT_349244 [Pisolithus marmoratus]|nr:hypothetical protein EDC04DRAFT_349244 [Pisolithus marmoratus]